MDKPLPCPFCGEAERLDIAISTIDSNDVFFVECGGCDCRGPVKDDPNDALTAWNRRAPWTVTREEAIGALGDGLDAAGVPLPDDKASRLFLAWAHDDDPFGDGAIAMVEALGGKVEG